MFRNRGEAGRILADKVSQYCNDPTALILALPRGGVAVGYQLKELPCRHHIFLGTKKIGQSDGRSMTRTKQRANSWSHLSAVSARRCITRVGGRGTPSRRTVTTSCALRVNGYGTGRRAEQGADAHR